MNTNTNALRQSQCTSIPIPEDKSNYWFPVRIYIDRLFSDQVTDYFHSFSTFTSSMSGDHQRHASISMTSYRWANGSFTSLDGGAVMLVTHSPKSSDLLTFWTLDV